MRGVTIAAIVGIAPFVLLSIMIASSTITDLADPCRTWGDQWGPSQSGGGTSSPSEAGCAANHTWTTESRVSAIFRTAWFPIGTIAALPLTVYGFEKGRQFPTAIALAILLAIGFPHTISATVIIAVAPAIVVATAARHAGLAPKPATVGVGIATLAATIMLIGNAIVSVDPRMSPIAWLVGATYPLQLIVVAALCLWPKRRATRTTADASAGT